MGCSVMWDREVVALSSSGACSSALPRQWVVVCVVGRIVDVDEALRW